MIEVLLHRVFIEVVGGAFFDVDGVFGAVAEAGAQAVAEVFGEEFGFAVDDLDRSLGAVGGAEAAAVALFLVDVNDFTGGLGCHGGLIA